MLSTTTVHHTTPVQKQTFDCSNITCREGFYCIEGAGICNPSCHSWNQYPHSTNIAIDFLVLMSACIGMVTGVGVVVIAGLRWKKVYAYIVLRYVAKTQKSHPDSEVCTQANQIHIYILILWAPSA